MDETQTALYVESLKQALKLLVAAEAARGVITRVDHSVAALMTKDAIESLEKAIWVFED